MEDKELKLKEFWCNLPTFVNSYDVPKLPKPLTTFFQLKLIEKGALIKKELIDGKWYYGNFRCSTLGRWNEKDNKFYYHEYNFGQYYLDKTNHFQDDDGYALFVPLREANDIELKQINDIEILIKK